ncbi:indole-3-glycerol phosphate synthase [Acetitomaculum ruminis DSM 5522]|uniref:Indole-3-glycerol phosphate synthase n=1 Tax=Acetitomaculum ruminis DSM 5522 TaxID=1120918 RepID=A0A1I0YLZ6_9FIRM|nr:indole-3-glycerol phosphate synthase TrpC [Acetitomaculum ruminis]SFB13927.1 indole-3-glycerol phosphate synthase [Acetitomaculum ruminis DSM 5522]
MILDKIVEDKKLRLIEHKKTTSLEEVKKCSYEKLKEEKENPKKESFYEAMTKTGLSIIGEFKQASPSLGNIKNNLSLEERINQYSKGVDAISTLTEEDHFNGNIEHFKQIRQMTTIPMLRKDFMIDEYQFYEAKAIGADAILLIAAILEKEEMKAFYELTKELKMDALIEVHNEEEIEKALYCDGKIIGVNNRDLRDFSIKLETTKRLKKYIPKDKCFISESGINTDKDIEFLKNIGIDGCLIGKAFMESDAPYELSKKWKEL